jgi:hypothetical protein
MKLTRPRFEIIANYPNNSFGEVGTILDRDWGKYPNGEENPPQWKISNFPHLFRKLNWWEKRTNEEMPKYLKITFDGKTTYYEIESWDMENTIGWIDFKKRICCDLCCFKPEFSYQPATEQEYLDSLIF